MSLFKNLFKKGGLIGKALSGVGNFAVSKITGGAVTNLFKTKKAVTPEEVRTESNAKAVLSSVGAAAGTMQALYINRPLLQSQTKQKQHKRLSQPSMLTRQ